MKCRFGKPVNSIKCTNAIRQKILDLTSGEIGLSDAGESFLGKLVYKYSEEAVICAIEIAFSRYYDGYIDEFDNAIQKIGGICYNRANNTASSEWHYYCVRDYIYANNKYIYLDNDTKRSLRDFIASYVQNNDDASLLMNCFNDAESLEEGFAKYLALIEEE